MQIPGTATAQDSAKWYLNTTGMFLWFAVFFLQPHKEERFLFPVYPLIAFSAACAVDAMQKIIFNVFVKRKFRHYLEVIENGLKLFRHSFNSRN